MSGSGSAEGAGRARRVQQVFEAVVELEPAQRRARLDDTCAGDPELRREVEGLIAALEQGDTQDVLPPLPAPPPARDLRGIKVHNYQVEGPLGAGGMATVHVARHLVFDRRAALKVLQPELSREPGMVQRFLNEARAANAIRHPNIVEVIDAGLLEPDGAPYILMELLEGQSLGARLRTGRMELGEVVRLGREIARALAAAHAQGIVHRDLKPENVFLVRRPGAPDAVKVLDFGIAKLRADVAGAAPHTRTGSFMGTPLYMSPEQCRNVSAVDGRADVYSLGAMLFEMTCGRPPFLSDAGPGDLIYLHLSATPARPASLRPEVPPALEAIILRCLAKRPEDRFATMEDVDQALAGALPAGRSPAPRRRLLAAAVVAFLLAAGAALGLTARRQRAAPIPAPSATAAVTSPAATAAVTSPAPPATAAVTTPAAAPPVAREAAPAPASATARPRASHRERAPGRHRPDIPEALRANPYNPR